MCYIVVVIFTDGVHYSPFLQISRGGSYIEEGLLSFLSKAKETDYCEWCVERAVVLAASYREWNFIGNLSSEDIKALNNCDATYIDEKLSIGDRGVILIDINSVNIVKEYD